jgi:hypothetical protein
MEPIDKNGYFTTNEINSLVKIRSERSPMETGNMGLMILIVLCIALLVNTKSIFELYMTWPMETGNMM